MAIPPSFIRHPDFQSRFVAPRHVDVWCPPLATAATAVRYPVIYMHDGQNLFDPTTSLTTGVAWGVDAALARLMATGVTAGAIIVGIWNTPLRVREYMPAQPLATAEATPARQQFETQLGGLPLSDNYLRFLVHELKPFIDTTYHTLPGPAHTFVMGSSMGGLISLYALAQYPAVFGAAGCVSTHWPIGQERLVDYFGTAVPPAGTHRLYFDYGTVGLDAQYEPYQQRMDGHMAAKGYTHGRDWATHKFPSADHNEAAWQARVEIPLRFLLG